MIREIINPTTNKIVITLPADMLNQELELLIFPTRKIGKDATRKLMETVFENAKTIHVEKNLDIDALMNEGNNAVS